MPGMYKSRGMGARPNGMKKSAPKNGPATRRKNVTRQRNTAMRKPMTRGRMR